MIPKELVGASVRPIVLSMLAQGDSYGYEIIQRVREYSSGELIWRDGSLYPVLHRLEDEGFIASYWERTDTGRRRKYYKISAKGQGQLRQERHDWLRVDSILARLWGLQPRITDVSL